MSLLFFSPQTPQASRFDTSTPQAHLLHPPNKRLAYGLDRWELIRPVGHGTLTEVFQARATGDTGRGGGPRGSYAVKILKSAWQSDERAVAIIRREAVVGRAISHRHLIPILASGVRRPPYYVVSPLLEGMTLADRFAQSSPLPVSKALWLARQVAEALEALDEGGWFHGDVKPANLFVSPTWHVTLLDLGFARRVNESGSIFDRCVVGSCSHTAPEMITSGVGGDIRSDLYSLGVVLFEALAGELPFSGRTISELIDQHRGARAPNLRERFPHLPTELTNLVSHLLAKDPMRRPQSPRELLERLVALEIATFG